MLWHASILFSVQNTPPLDVEAQLLHDQRCLQPHELLMRWQKLVDIRRGDHLQHAARTRCPSKRPGGLSSPTGCQCSQTCPRTRPSSSACKKNKRDRLCASHGRIVEFQAVRGAPRGAVMEAVPSCSSEPSTRKACFVSPFQEHVLPCPVL